MYANCQCNVLKQNNAIVFNLVPVVIADSPGEINFSPKKGKGLQHEHKA
jgi:hypothetical protein